MRLPTLLLTGMAFMGCATIPATRFPTPRERVTECESLCTNLGLKMSAIVVIMNSAGCVCEPRHEGKGMAASASAASGGAIIAAAAEAQQQQPTP